MPMRVVDRARDHAAGAVDAAFAGALEAERMARRGRVLGEQHLDVGHVVQRRHQVIGEGRRQRLAGLVVDELLRQRAAEPLRAAADELARRPSSG